ncbi:MAG TPA: DUF5916 domain-containing protein [Balneolaceae bacterium]
MNFPKTKSSSKEVAPPLWSIPKGCLWHNSFAAISYIFFILFLMLGFTGITHAQTATNGHSKIDSSAELPVIQAVRVQGDERIELDGELNEAIWQQAPVATGFIQRVPDSGEPATERTEARIVYTEDAIFVGIKAYDSAMDSVAATLFRKDGSAYSDWVYVNIDSYNDNRTSFSFAVNPRGVRKDILTFNDSNEDIRWDAIWQAETSIQDDYWVAEFRIPLSQLRFNADKKVQNWGINFQRRIARKDEISFWAPTPQNASGFVSKYGTLKGLKGLGEPARLEITPYVSANLTRAPGSSANPYYQQNEWGQSIGADIQYGLSSNFTLTATINPDFGQVEADPAVINLSAYETFFPEQRPFFLEGTDIFQFGATQTYNRFGNPMVFYSRRIGRAPQGDISQAGIQADYVDRPDRTTIAGAVKLSGKTESGLSVGVLNALTTRENATYTIGGGSDQQLSIEPPTNYLVGRVKQDFNNGNTVIGGYLSSVNRFMSADYLKSSLHSASYIGGVDFEHSWNDQEWTLSGAFSGSLVQGTEEAILQTQLLSSRYYNRVDADYLSVDPDKTSLSGYAGDLSLGRFGGEHWRGSLTYEFVSPGYEVNDIGFENRADYHGVSYLLMYREPDPAEPFRFYETFIYANQRWNFGGDLTYNAIAIASNFNLTNLWSFHPNAGYNFSVYDDRLLRGGPLARTPDSYYISGVINSDPSRKVSFTAGHLRSNDVSGGMERDFFVDLTIRPTSYIQLTISPNYNYRVNTGQYVTQIEDPTAVETYGKRYIFADIDQQTFSTAFRLDWTFTPEISLQTYVRPFITSGDFYNYKEFTQPKGYEFAVYGEDRGTINRNNSSYTVDPDGAGPAQSFSFRDRDFNFKAIQSNVVFRWQYRPGSALFVVWQQDRSASTINNDLQLQRDVSQLFRSEPTNVFLVKLTYWFGT